jgi:hypothetical protein
VELRPVKAKHKDLRLLRESVVEQPSAIAGECLTLNAAQDEAKPQIQNH